MVEGAPVNYVGSSNPITAGKALAFDGTFVYLAFGDKVGRIRASTGLHEANLPTLNQGAQEALVFDGTSLYATAVQQVIKLNINSMGLDGSPIAFPGSSNVVALAFDGTYVYAASQVIATSSTGQVSYGNGNVVRF